MLKPPCRDFHGRDFSNLPRNITFINGAHGVSTVKTLGNCKQGTATSWWLLSIAVRIPTIQAWSRTSCQVQTMCPIKCWARFHLAGALILILLCASATMRMTTMGMARTLQVLLGRVVI